MTQKIKNFFKIKQNTYIQIKYNYEQKLVNLFFLIKYNCKKNIISTKALS